MTSRQVFNNIMIYTLALIWFMIAGLPFLFMFLTGFKSQFELFSSSPWALPETFILDNYREVLANQFFRFMFNSITVVSIAVALVVVTSSMAAYVFARIKFGLSRFLFLLIIAGLIVPIHITMIPVYLLTTNIGVYDSLWALVGPYVAFSTPVSVFILTEFMRQIPRELEDAARIDGCSPISTFFRIILPLSRPGLVTIAIFNAVNLWKEFVFAFVLTTRPEVRTLPLAIWEFQGMFSMNIPAIMAVLALSTLPLIIAYILGQEQLVKGIMAGALKG